MPTDRTWGLQFPMATEPSRKAIHHAMSQTQLQNVRRVLIANRGEIAVRCIHGCKAAGVTSVAIYTKSDAGSLHVAAADEAVLLAGEGSAGYLDVDAIIAICRQHSIDTVIPGYGFLSENVHFAKMVTDAGMVFAGPSSESITDMGLKHRAREVAAATGVPIVPGTDLISSETEALAQAERLKYPVMVKATGGGGGMGLQICRSPQDVKAALSMVRNRGEKLFKNSGVLIEKYYPRSRHIEVQVFGNGTEVIHFGERECSIQRRHQKVIEECPSPFVEQHPGLRQRLTECATKYATALHYKSAGTVEFLVDDETGDFFFLEMNTRLQVEHGITELCYGVDLVVLMLRQADMEQAGKTGIPSSELQSLARAGPTGWAIETRIYAEDPYRGFAPSPGVFQQVAWPKEDGVRVDTWIQPGQEVGLHYDPLLAKLMVHAPTRDDAISKLSSACTEGAILRGPVTNMDFVRKIIVSEAFVAGTTLTTFLDTSFTYYPHGIDVVDPGSFSTIQDFPARATIGHGIARGGPMDSLSSRVANYLAGNAEGIEVVEITLAGPELLFTDAATISICGAHTLVTIDGYEKPMWSTLVIQAGQTLKIGRVDGAGCRVYLAVRGGFPNIALMFGSKSTVPSQRFGGCQGRALRKGDFLELDNATSKWAASTRPYTLPSSMIPDLDVKEVYVMQGPHDSADIMTSADRNMMYEYVWKVGHNSSRTGVRLLGPAPQWARSDGGEAGSHPSNYIDYGYPSPGGVNWGGDSPCIFTTDSPNFGGLICSSTVISADLWKLGQLKPGASLILTPVSFEDALKQIRRTDDYLTAVENVIHGKPANSIEAPSSWRLDRLDPTDNAAILDIVEGSSAGQLKPKVTYRQGGDRFLLLEFGEQKTDVVIVARIHLLLEKLREAGFDLLTPHIGSVAIEYEPLDISQRDILARVLDIEASIEVDLDLSLPCREWRLPLVMDHPEIEEHTQKYMQTVRDEAAYLPDNLEFLAKCNGLKSRRDVFEQLVNTEYLIAAVGFICGAPMLTPLTPKNLMCQKYNPTRVSTPGGTIGLGGPIIAAYPLEAPGGYMMAARTLELWDPYGTKPGFTPERPWLFESFDRVTYFEVSVEEYDSLATDLAAGRYHWQISQSTFNLREAYERFKKAESDPEVIEYKRRQQEGLAEQAQAEKQLYDKWQARVAADETVGEADVSAAENDSNTILITSPMPASLWKVEVNPGDQLEGGLTVAILEAMKLEVNIPAPEGAEGFKVHSLVKKPGSILNTGDVIMVAKRST